jgi:protein ImuB
MAEGEMRMKQELYVCVHAAEFPAQALLRLRTGLESQPVAVLEGRAPLETVCSLNRAAMLKGAALGMTRLEAEGISELRLLTRSLETEAAARAILFECAAHFSPRIENASQGTACACVLDIAGTERLFGPPEELAQRLRQALAATGFRASVAVSANFHAARFKAASTRGITVIPEKHEAESLAKLPIGLLELNEGHAETFALWGIRSLGELAALAETDLVTRLGPQAAKWRKLALGELPHTFQPIEEEFCLKEFCDFDTPVDKMDSLLFIGARMIDCLAARAATHALSLASLAVEMKLAGGLTAEHTIRPAIPTVDRKFLLKLLQLEIAAHPPQADVLSLALTAEAGQSSKVQLGLFAPQTPEPSRLDVTIARLKAIAGDERVGSPVLEDSHRPGSFRMDGFTVASQSNASESFDKNCPRLALRRMRPPLPIRVHLDALRPVAFRNREQNFKIAAAYGPWKSSGCWWSTDDWNVEEWDVLAEDSNGSSVACLLVRNCAQNEWCVEAFYD